MTRNSLGGRPTERMDGMSSNDSGRVAAAVASAKAVQFVADLMGGRGEMLAWTPQVTKTVNPPFGATQRVVHLSAVFTGSSAQEEADVVVEQIGVWTPRKVSMCLSWWDHSHIGGVDFSSGLLHLGKTLREECRLVREMSVSEILRATSRGDEVRDAEFAAKFTGLGEPGFSYNLSSKRERLVSEFGRIEVVLGPVGWGEFPNTYFQVVLNQLGHSLVVVQVEVQDGANKEISDRYVRSGGGWIRYDDPPLPEHI